MNGKRITKITEALNSLKTEDIYSILMFTLYKLKDNPNYLALSELCYLFDREALTKFLTYYGGMTITLPTLRDLRLLLEGFTLYQYVNVQGKPFEEGLKALSCADFTADEVKETYAQIVEVISNYEFDARWFNL